MFLASLYMIVPAFAFLYGMHVDRYPQTPIPTPYNPQSNSQRNVANLQISMLRKKRKYHALTVHLALHECGDQLIPRSSFNDIYSNSSPDKPYIFKICAGCCPRRTVIVSIRYRPPEICFIIVCEDTKGSIHKNALFQRKNKKGIPSVHVAKRGKCKCVLLLFCCKLS